MRLHEQKAAGIRGQSFNFAANRPWRAVGGPWKTEPDTSAGQALMRLHEQKAAGIRGQSFNFAANRPWNKVVKPKETKPNTELGKALMRQPKPEHNGPDTKDR